MSLQKPWIAAFIGLGSNLDNPVQHINTAQQAIAELPEVEAIAFSPLYTSTPVGPQDQPDYINAVMQINTRLTAMQLLTKLQQIENQHGRIRTERWGARTLDLDVLLFDQKTIDQPELKIPHPEMPNRAFVLYPLADIAGGDLQIPGYGVLRDLLASCPPLGLQRIYP